MNLFKILKDIQWLFLQWLMFTSIAKKKQNQKSPEENN